MSGIANGGAPSLERHEVLAVQEITSGVGITKINELYEPIEGSKSDIPIVRRDELFAPIEVPRIVAEGARTEATLRHWAMQRGAKVAQGLRRLNSRTVTRFNRDVPESSQASDADSAFMPMPRRTTAAERREAARVLEQHNRRTKRSVPRFA